MTNYYGGSASETITGGDAADVIYGHGGEDTLDGGAGNDKLYGDTGTDTLYGGLGNDYLDGQSGADHMEGGAGDDIYAVDSLGDVIIETADGGYDTVNALVSYTLASNLEKLILGGTTGISGGGNDLNNTIGGNGSGNALRGMGGDDSIAGYDGDDYIDGGPGKDYITGGLGNDTAAYDDADAGVKVSLLLQTKAQDTGGAGLDTLLGFENLSGSAYDDALTGDAGDNVLSGKVGDDKLFGGLGADRLYGGAGTDTLTGGDGNDLLDGGDGADSLYGGAGDDVIHLSGDTATGGAGADTFILDTGATATIADFAVGGGGDKLAFAGALAGSGWDGASNPFDSGFLKLVADGPDILLQVDLDGDDGPTAPVTVARLAGVSLANLSGANFAGGYALPTALNINDSDDSHELLGGALDDVIKGNGGDDTIYGRGGNDKLYSGDGYDNVYGGAGNDILDGGGDATLYGGAGDDTYYIHGFSKVVLDEDWIPWDEDDTGPHYYTEYHITTVTESAGAGIDTLISDYNFHMGANVENLTLIGTATYGYGNELDNILTGNDVRNVMGANDGNDTLYGGGGDDDLSGNEGDDTIYGGDGRDNMNGNHGADFLDGGLGNDVYSIDDVGDRIVDSGGEDTVVSTIGFVLAPNLEHLILVGAAAANGTGNASLNRITGNDNVNVIDGQDGDDWLWAGGGADTVYGGNGADELAGARGDDQLYGGAGNDLLVGYEDGDTLDGGAGHDSLTGGSGADTFVFASALSADSDTVTDWNAAEGDKVQVSGTAFGLTAGLGLGAGNSLETAWFVAASDGHDATADHGQFIFQSSSSELWWDADGTGAGAAVLIATFQGAAVTIDDIIVGP